MNGLAGIRTCTRVLISSHMICATFRRSRAALGLLFWFACDDWGISTDVTAGALLNAQGAR